MKISVYRQAAKTRPDGKTVYKGEDARPYVDDQVLFVADGLGGASAIIHEKLKQELFEKERLLETLFDGVYEDYQKEEFANYVLTSFEELFAVKDCYTKNIHNKKKSGYFASRIATAIVLHEMLYNKKVSAEKLFERYAGTKDEGEKEALLRKVGDYFKKCIQTNIRKIAKNANLVYESSFSGLALLGTTMCATIYLEHDDFVETIYLTAGDSRPYVWSEKKGLQQVLEDQEGNDGGMTNYIKANDDADFEIRCNYFRFDKPCIIFNASDGCFDSGAFISQLAFEKTILDIACASKTEDEMSEGLKEFFTEYGKHDDSSTIAMKIIGYETFEGFKKDAACRLEKLNDEYFSVMPGLLDTDYVAEFEEYESTYPTKMALLKEKMEQEKGVEDYKEQAVREHYSPFHKAIADIDSQINGENDKITLCKTSIKSIIKRNIIHFIPCLESMGSQIDKALLSRVLKIVDDISECKRIGENYIDSIKAYKSDLGELVQPMDELLEQLLKVGVPNTYDDFDYDDFRDVDGCQNYMNELFDFLNGLRTHGHGALKKLWNKRNEYIDKSNKLVEDYPEIVEMLLSMIISDRDIVNRLGISPEEKENINNEMESIDSATDEIERLESKEKEKALDKAKSDYWNSNYVTIITDIVKNQCDGISNAVLMEATQLIQELEEHIKGTKDKCDKQRKLFQQYDKGYCEYIGECAE